jgi:hypothetical protein
MANIAALLKQEITRLVRKEIKAETESLRKANSRSGGCPDGFHTGERPLSCQQFPGLPVIVQAVTKLSWSSGMLHGP